MQMNKEYPELVRYPLFASCIPLVFHDASEQLLVKDDRSFESSRPDQDSWNFGPLHKGPFYWPALYI
jgi:hypothetical protein